MSTYIQINIYNQTLETLKIRGISLETIMKTLDCGNCHITEMPIHPPKQQQKDQTTLGSLIKNRNSQMTPKKPFKSISAEVCSVKPLSLSSVLKMREKEDNGPSTLFNLFDEWDPVANLGPPVHTAPNVPPNHPSTSTDHEADQESPLKLYGPSGPSGAPETEPSAFGFKAPKEEIIEEEEQDMKIEMNDSEAASREQMAIISDLLKQKTSNLTTNVASPGEGSLKSVQISMDSLNKSRRQLMSEDPEIATTIYTIICSYPGCEHQYNWRVKYGKLRLLDHALTHSNTRIPCKLCGFETTNVRRMRSHYQKHHPNQKVQGYGMKALVNEEHDNEEELKQLWQTCYANYIGLVGEAGLSEGDKFKRKSKKRKLNEGNPTVGTISSALNESFGDSTTLDESFSSTVQDSCQEEPEEDLHLNLNCNFTGK